MANVEMEAVDGEIMINPLENDPFQGEGAYIDLEGDKKYNVSQLASEIEQRTGERKVSIALVKHEGQRRMWFSPGGMDKRTVRGAVQSHRENENWGLSQDQVEVRDLLYRLKSGQTLSVEDTTKVLKSMVQDQEDTGMSMEQFNN